jgi:hypothetical protein
VEGLLTEVDSLQDVEKEIVEGEKEIREEIEVDKKECEKLCGGYKKVARLKNDLVKRGKQKIKRQNERRKQTKKSIKLLCGENEKVARLKNDLVERGKQKIKRQNERRKQTTKSVKLYLPIFHEIGRSFKHPPKPSLPCRSSNNL